MADAPTNDNPKTPSSDYQQQIQFWCMVDDILRGVEAMRAVGSVTRGYANMPGPATPYAYLSQLYRGGRQNAANQSPYLPQFPDEQADEYELRRTNAPLTNIYQDISRNLAAKPFSKTLELAEDTPDDLIQLSQNIDGQGHNLHVFARDVFKSGLDKGIDWILVDYTQVSPGVTLADERAMGARPYWVHIPADRMLAIYSDFLNGQEVIVHARIYECSYQRTGYGEVNVERVRVINREPIFEQTTNEDGDIVYGKITGYGPATWQLYESQNGKDDQGREETVWIVVDQGEYTIGIIPLVPFISGTRKDGWVVEPPLRDLVWMQVEEFQQESNLKTIKELAAFPMLAGNGVQPPDPRDGSNTNVRVGPHVVLFAPPTGNTGSGGQFQFVEPAATSLQFLKQDLEGLRKEMRELGMQPLTDANLTVITTANVSMKAHNQVQAWALQLKDALEQAWIITCKWLGRNESPSVNVHTDFGVDIAAEAEPALLLQAAQANKISDETLWEELKRRGVLSDDFDPDEEEKRLAEQQQGMDLTPEVQIDPVTGRPIPQQQPPQFQKQNQQQQQAAN